MTKNICLLTDSYKYSHHKQTPPGTQHIYSYLEARVGGRFPETMFYGLQYFLHEYFAGEVITKFFIEQAKAIVDQHMGPGVFNYEGWMSLVEKHKGTLPVKIRAVPEGTSVPLDNVLLVMENTDPEFPWLTNFLETLIVELWYPCTVGTLSRETKKIILRYLQETGDPTLISFKLHDFGCRGASSVESAGIGGSAHLVNFMGTDTIPAITLAMEYYKSGVCGFSIPASEHSTITSWGKDHEADAMRNMLTQYPKGLVACVSDSFDLEKACKDIWGTQLRQTILDREGTLVVRPDSGDPVEITLKVFEWLAEKFGTTTNAKGYRVLHPNIRIIQGDGCSITSIEEILENYKRHGVSADNIAFGMGGGLLQKVNRDTQRFAMKCSESVIDGKAQPVHKNPITDTTKKSKAGRLALIKENGVFRTVPEGHPKDLLETVFENGKIVKEYTFYEVRINAQV